MQLTVLIDLMILFRSLWRDHRVGRTVNQCHRTGILLSYLINRQLLRGPQIKATNFKAITNIQIGRNMLWIIGRTLQNTLLRILAHDQAGAPVSIVGVPSIVLPEFLDSPQLVLILDINLE
ncbi:hypothetical protein WP50_17730 [Lactiplantibacillus plantarum]|nr:hypothetical protein WP50_17730 [Lactiplantibacillus plantarum]